MHYQHQTSIQANHERKQDIKLFVGSKFNYCVKGLSVVQSKALMKALYNQFFFISLDTSIRVPFNKENPLTKALSLIFSIKDLGALYYFLGVEFIPTKCNLFLTKQKYIRDLFESTWINGAKSINTLLSNNQQYSCFTA